MNFVINSYNQIVNDTVSVCVFISSVFVCIFRVYFDSAFKNPRCSSSITFSIKHTKIMMVIMVRKIQLRDKSKYGNKGTPYVFNA